MHTTWMIRSTSGLSQRTFAAQDPSMRVPLLLASLGGAILLLSSCKKEDDPEPATPGETGPRLIMKFAFDSTQVRLNNLGQPANVPAGHGAQSPQFNVMSAHYVEFAPTAFTQLGQGSVMYHAP